MFVIIFSVFVLFAVVVYGDTSTVDPVTCGSVIKLLHIDTQFHLQSHPIAYGSGLTLLFSPPILFMILSLNLPRLLHII